MSVVQSVIHVGHIVSAVGTSLARSTYPAIAILVTVLSRCIANVSFEGLGECTVLREVAEDGPGVVVLIAKGNRRGPAGVAVSKHDNGLRLQ